MSSHAEFNDADDSDTRRVGRSGTKFGIRVVTFVGEKLWAQSGVLNFFLNDLAMSTLRLKVLTEALSSLVLSLVGRPDGTSAV